MREARRISTLPGSMTILQNTFIFKAASQMKDELKKKELNASTADILACISSSQPIKLGGLNSYRNCILDSEGGSGRDMCHSSAPI